MTGAEFHDLSELALNEEGQSWGNLGYWQDSECDYSSACRELALKLGTAAELNQKSVVFDAGFGCGDQLQLWLDHFQVSGICGINLSQSQTEYALKLLTDSDRADPTKSILQGNIDQQSVWSETIGTRKISHIIALDCAYHFPNRTRFFQNAKTHLPDNGKLALTDFVLADQHLRSSLKHHFLRLMLRLSRIPSANIVEHSVYETELVANGFSDVNIEDISKPVMIGFADWYGRNRDNIHKDLSFTARAKYRVTAKFLKWAYRHSVLRYCLITAQKTQ